MDQTPETSRPEVDPAPEGPRFPQWPGLDRFLAQTAPVPAPTHEVTVEISVAHSVDDARMRELFVSAVFGLKHLAHIRLLHAPHGQYERVEPEDVRHQESGTREHVTFFATISVAYSRDADHDLQVALADLTAEQFANKHDGVRDVTYRVVRAL